MREAAYITALLLAFLVASPCSYGEEKDGNDKSAAPSSSHDETKDKEGKRIVNNLTLLPIRDVKLRMRLWKELVRLAQPEMLEVSANESTLEVLRARCGSAPPDLQLILGKLNPGRNQWISNEARQLTFIPCPFWAFRKYNHPETTIPIRKGQSIDKVLPLYMGLIGPVNKKRIRDPQKILDAEGMAIANGTLLIDYVTKPISFRLRDEIKEDNVEVARKLTEQFRDAMPGDIANNNNADVENSYFLVAQEGPQGGPQGEVIGSSCKGPDSDNQWPYDMEQIAKIYRDMLGELNSNKPVVLVADTGLDLSDPTVNRNLWTDQRVVRGIEKRYGKNSHGTNLTASIKGSIDISPTYQFAYHGTEVVKIIVGGSSAPSTLLAQFEIAIGKVIPDREPFNIGADAIGSTFMYAQYIPNTKVLNLSVVIASEEQKLIAGMQAAGNMLVVSAAGNNNRWLEDTHLYPPCLTSYPDRLIVVGAHDWENRKADFSNYGESVDLLAPGCGIPIRGRDGEILLHSGTSYAAPFVSFTAALLSTYGMSPGEIKGRILLTVDFDKTLRGVARSAGRLNIENALSYRDDILVVKAKGKDDSGKNIEKILTLYGDFEPTPGQIWICKNENLPDRILAPHTVGRIVTLGGNKAMVWDPSQGTLINNYCDSIEGAVKFRERKPKSESEYKSYAWSDVISVTPKMSGR